MSRKNGLNIMEIKLILGARDMKSVTDIHNYYCYVNKCRISYDWIARKLRELESFGYMRAIRRNYGNNKFSKYRGNISFYCATSRGIEEAERCMKLTASSYSDSTGQATLVDVLRKV